MSIRKLPSRILEPSQNIANIETQIIEAQGIKFPGTQVASADPNTLDDYEEGTFTITLSGTSSGPTTPINQTANYTKIGNIVCITHAFTNVNTTGASGELEITGLPFVTKLGAAFRTVGTVWGNIAVTTGGANITTSMACTMDQGSTTIGVSEMYNFFNAHIKARTAAYLYISITYFTDS